MDNYKIYLLTIKNKYSNSSPGTRGEVIIVPFNFSLSLALIPSLVL